MNQNPQIARIEGNDSALTEALTAYFSGQTGFGGVGGQSSAMLNPNVGYNSSAAQSQRVAGSSSGLGLSNSFKNERGSFLSRQ